MSSSKPSSVENLVTIVPTTFKTNMTRSGSIPHFAITRERFEKITDKFARFFVHKIINNKQLKFSEKSPRERQRIFKKFLDDVSIEIPRSLGIKGEWGQKRKHFLPFRVLKKNTYTPVIKYNKTGVIKSVTGVSRTRTGNNYNLSTAGLEFPFTGLSKTLPLGTIKEKELKKGVPEIIVPPSTKFISPTSTKSLGEHLKAKIKKISGFNLNQNN